MPRIDLPRWAVLASLAALGLPAGCGHLDRRPREHASSSLLASGPSPRITGRQAADVDVALGRAAEDEGKLDEAEAAFLSAVKKDPGRADAEAKLAILRDRKGDAAGADRHFNRALALDPKNPEILCDRGYSLYLRRRWAESESSLKQALASDPAHARSHNNLGLVLGRRGEREAALDEFARAGCDESDARANLGLVLALEGRFAESRHEYAVALANKPASAHAQEGLRAANVALAGRGEARALAKAPAPNLAMPGADPDVRRASATSGP